MEQIKTFNQKSHLVSFLTYVQNFGAGLKNTVLQKRFLNIFTLAGCKAEMVRENI